MFIKIVHVPIHQSRNVNLQTNKYALLPRQRLIHFLRVKGQQLQHPKKLAKPERHTSQIPHKIFCQPNMVTHWITFYFLENR